ncbi:DUF4435 domain-containing protein [Bacillus cereus]|uniref:DUF4435 domain-containing protein n=1 Tax=Bacillus cereus TaxID=1396 RepID=UPI000BF9779F|nr:DUF4435 domain-containing protein [Bacillus cereus]PER69234.1 hypothetical protein CN502_10180 [Bacillus cereus]PGL38325.1 hypothetical protein CN913_15505 [Bacillus cereus]
MSNSDELLYSSEASSTRYVYYQDLNDINIFIEDAGKEYEYETIFKRLLGENYKIGSIFSAGGKSGVEEKFREFGIANPSNPKIKNFYIVDGDFDRYISSEEMIDNPYYLYLKTYNIENYFIDEDACVQFSKGRLKCLDYEVKEKLKFPEWRDSVVGQATKLFLAYCFVKKYYPEYPTLSRSTGEFIDFKTGFERQDGAYDEYWAFVNSLDNRVETEILKIKEKYIDINGEDFFNLICGKFLLDSLCCYLRVIIESKFNHDDFKWHLINHFDISKLDYVKDSILEVMSA